MRQPVFIHSVFLLIFIVGCAQQAKDNSDENICNPAWYQSVEQRLKISDSAGHGPDLGSSEWRSAVEFKLGILNKTNKPAIESNQWCHYIETQFTH